MRTGHQLPINDIDHAWTEDRTYATADGVGKFTVFMGKCTCGQTFEGRDASEVTRQYVAHTAEKDGY